MFSHHSLLSKYHWIVFLIPSLNIVSGNQPYSLIEHVTDRKGHDRRYAIDPEKIHNELGWLPETMFKDGIKKTIQWYLDNKDWWENIISGDYQNYYDEMYGKKQVLDKD